ncbi:LysR family transcriptional regulator [Psychromonas sp. RZ22]|uniref:LysR family transcriptional regulator n=1 Tax=Psychromonas algarum TaxID=2555643 RepID=UPI00106778A4|nr:LysR substrate-binding domain-containing protein [Psychromonas sp. RZ22]TEW55643.1 LysR family transcriptional regulator [Psychromonas sp. RZ22]
MKYTLKQLLVFNAIASHESVSRAAAELCMTQSAVSMSLAQLENLLDRPLFIRHGNRLTLSYWGRWLKPQARKLIKSAELIDQGFKDQNLISGSLSVCASQTAAEHLIPKLISHIDSDYPELRIDLSIRNSDEVIRGLLNHEFELGIIEGRIDDSRIVQEDIVDDRLVIFTNTQHLYANEENVNLIQLEKAKWILREHGAGTRRIFETAVKGLIKDLDVWKEYESVAVIKELVKNGNYLGCLPLLDIKQEMERGELVLLNTPELNMDRSLSFVWLNGQGLNPLKDCVMAETKRLVDKMKKNKPNHFYE